MEESLGHQPLALVPNASHLSYQLYAWSPITKKADPDRKLLTAVSIAFAWLRSQFRNITETPEEIMMPEDAGIDFLKAFQIDNGYYLGTAFNKEKRKWAMRLIEPDMGPNPGKSYNRMPVPGRLYQTDVAFSITKDKLECGFRTQCIQPTDCNAMDWEVFRLKMVKMLMAGIGLEHVKPLKLEPFRDLSVSSISSLINNPARQIPIILITEETGEVKPDKPLPGLDDIKPNLPAFSASEHLLARYIDTKKADKDYINADTIAARSVGFAHTCYIKADDIKPLSYRIGRELSPDGGEIAVIMPVQSYPENDWFYTKESIRSHGSEIGEQGEPLTGYAAFEQAFINRLSKVTKQNLCIKYGDLMFLNEIRLLGNQQQIGSGEVGSKFTDLEKEVGESRQIISDLQRKNGGLESAWAETTADNRKLKAELEKIQDEALKQTLKLHQELDASVTEASKLREEKAYLASKPYRYKDMPDWIEQNYSEKLILTQKAKAALKAGEYENIPLLCDAVRCLAVDFNDFADKRITFDEYAIRLKTYGLEHSGDSAESTKNTYISYKPEYPEGSGRFVELRMHLRTNTDKSYDKHDPRGVLRIYFTYDDELKKVVIHHLPSHLPV